SKTVESTSVEQLPQKNEDFPLTAVPSSSRKSIWSLAPILIGFTLYSGTLFAGGLVGTNFRFFPDLVGLIVLGNLILGLYAGGLGYIAAKTGLSTVLMARCSFGEFGSRWVDFILGFTQVGWYAWGSALIADLLIKLAGVPMSLNWLLIIVATYLFCITAYIGYQAMDWVSRLAVPAMIILMIWSLSLAWQDIGGYTQLQAINPAAEMGIGEALTVIIGTFVSGGTQVTNWSRFASSPKAGFWATFLAFFLANGFLIDLLQKSNKKEINRSVRRKTMTYKKVKHLRDREFKRLCGVRKETFAQMVKLVEENEAQKTKIVRPSKLTLENQVLMTLEY
ncbi:cytosine permease, partial [Hyella patelloides]|uniref:cytosine permease n=1 Tax=Hyella patelloides TaxID=1982969 RepID=UPI001C9799D4